MLIDRAQPNLDLLACIVAFAAVAESGSFTAAARRLNTTRSAVGKQVQRLETAWGVRLLNRNTRSVTLTEPGRMALEAASNVGRMAAQAREAATSLNETPRGRLRMTASVACGHALVVPSLSEFASRHPDVSVELVLTDRFLDLVEEGFDLAIRITTTPPDNMVARRLGSIATLICASPHLRGVGAVRTPSDLELLPALRDARGSAGGWLLRRGDERVCVHPRGTISVNSSEARLELALQALGISLLPSYVCRDAVHRGELIALLPEWTPQAHYGGVIWGVRVSERRLLPKVRAMTDFLLEQLQRPEDHVATSDLQATP